MGLSRSWLYGSLQVHMQSVPITKIVIWNHAHDEVYSIQHNVIKLVGDLRQVSGFSGYTGYLHQ